MNKIYLFISSTLLLISCSNSNEKTSTNNKYQKTNNTHQEQKKESNNNHIDPFQELKHKPTTNIITTDGVNTSTSAHTSTPDTYEDNSINNSEGLEEAYEYARKAYRTPEDIKNAQHYLKKAMNAFQNAESEAEKINCARASWSISGGYTNARKGYNSQTPKDIEYFAKKTMNHAEKSLNEFENCKKN